MRITSLIASIGYLTLSAAADDLWVGFQYPSGSISGQYASRTECTELVNVDPTTGIWALDAYATGLVFEQSNCKGPSYEWAGNYTRYEEPINPTSILINEQEE